VGLVQQDYNIIQINFIYRFYNSMNYKYIIIILFNKLLNKLLFMEYYLNYYLCNI